MFERFTEKAIRVIMLAQEESRRLGHNFVGTEQLLLGLIAEGTGVASKTLKSMGVNIKEAREEVEKIIGRGRGFVAVEIPFTPRLKMVIKLSEDEAKQLGHDSICTEHLLLGLIKEGDGVGIRVLENLAVDLDKCRLTVMELLSDTSYKDGSDKYEEETLDETEEKVIRKDENSAGRLETYDSKDENKEIWIPEEQSLMMKINLLLGKFSNFFKK